VNQFLVGFAVLALWVLSLLAHPFGRCPRCYGKRVVMRGTKRRRRPVRCWLCKGIGRRQRPGSKTVHRAVRYLAAYHARSGRRTPDEPPLPRIAL
jgi:hypothetical protein